LRSLKIVKYVQHLAAVGGQLVLQRSHVTQVACFSVLAAVLAESFITFVIFPRQKQSTRRTRSFTFAYGFSLCGALLVVRETVRLLKCLLHPSQEMRTSENVHGGLAIPSLHVWS